MERESDWKFEWKIAECFSRLGLCVRIARKLNEV